MKFRLKGNFATRKVWLNGNELLPDKSQNIYNHSPDGFMWGYNGSGPSQLALAILLELYGEVSRFPIHYQFFRTQHIAPLPHGNFNIEIEL